MQSIKHFKYTRRLLIALVLTITAAITFSALKHNVHQVVAQQVYRSAQISPHIIKVMKYFKGINSIINLRGKNPQQKWYRDEIKISEALKITHYDLALSSTHFPDHNKLKQLVNLIETAPKPVLLHCESGADRAGLASAIALTLLTEQPLQTIKKQFSWLYLVTSKNSVGIKVFNAYQTWLQQNYLTSSKKNFTLWLDNI